MQSIKSSSSFKRALAGAAFGLVFAGFAASGFGQATSGSAEAVQVLDALYPAATGSNTLTLGNATAAELENVVTIITGTTPITISSNLVGGTVAKPQSVTVSGSNTANNTAAAISYIFSKQPAASTVTADDLINSYWVASGETAMATGTTYLGGVTAAAAAYTSFESSLAQTTIDADEATIAKYAINLDAGFGVTILEDVLHTSDPGAVQQGVLISGFLGSTSTFLSGAGSSLTAFATNLQSVDSGYITNTGTFLETVSTKLTAAGAPASFIAGYTSTYSAGTLGTTATNITAAMTSLVTAATRESIFDGLLLSGSANSYSASSFVPGIVTGIVSGQTYSSDATNDTAKATLASAFITFAGDTDASIIAGAAGTVLSDPVDDAGNFTTSVLGNTLVKAGTGSNGIVGVTESIANDFALGDITTTSASNFSSKVAVAQAGMKADSATTASGTLGAFNVAQAVVQQILTDGSSSAAETTFAANFVGAIDTKTSNFTAINDADRAAAALGIAELYNASYAGSAIQITGSAVATDAISPLTINAVAQPILNYFATNGGSTLSEMQLSGSIAAQIVQQPGVYLTNTYSPIYLTSQLILGAKVGLVPNLPVINGIAQGTLAAQGNGADAFLTSVAGDIGTVADLPYLKQVMTYLASGSNGLTYTDIEIMADLANVGGAPSQSGTLAAILSTQHLTDTPAIAYSAADASGVTTDLLRLTIAQDVAKMTGSSTYAVALSSTLAPLVSTSIADKGTLAEDLAKIDLVPTDIASITLDVSQSVPSNDPTLSTDLSTIAKDAILAFPTANKTLANVAPLIEGVVTGYTGSTSGTPASTIGYANAAAFTGALTTAEGAVSGLGVALLADLVPQQITVSGTAAPVAGAFAKYLPTLYATVAQYATSQDGTLTAGSFSDAAAIATAILTNVTAATAPTDAANTAKIIVANITSGDLTAALATSVADAADAITKVTALQIETTATDIVGEVPTLIQQATANSIAHDLSSQLVTTTAATPTTLLTAQEALSEDIAAVSSSLAADQIAANVAVYATSDANIGTIAIDTLNKYNTVNTITVTGSGVATFAQNLMTDLAAQSPTIDSSFSYTDAASIAKTLIAGISSTAIGGATADAAASSLIAEDLVEQQVTKNSAAPAIAALIGASFTTSIPADAISIAAGAVNTSLYVTPLTAEQSGTIGATIAAALSPTLTTTPAFSGSIAAVVALAVNIPNGQTVNDNIATVAGVFAGTNAIPVTSYVVIAGDLAAKANLGSHALNYNDNAVAAIAAAFAPGIAGSTSTVNGLPALLKALIVAYPESAADILGAVIDATTGLNGAPSAATLESDAYTDLTTSVPALTILDALTLSPGMATGFTGTAWTTGDKSSVTTLFTAAKNDAASSDYANITVDETPIVPM